MNEERLKEIDDQLRLLISEIEGTNIENVPECAARRDLIENLKDAKFWSGCWLSFVKFHTKKV